MVFVVVIIGTIGLVLVVMIVMNCNPEEVPMDMGRPAVSRRLLGACPLVRMGDARSLENEGQHQK
jgi:hypothetical protein